VNFSEGLPIAEKGLADRIIKVNHAGEHGAVNIYAGQILMARLTARDMLSDLTRQLVVGT
jgi:3-demethoxyubiquinol 3-hydroxylase